MTRRFSPFLGWVGCLAALPVLAGVHERVLETVRGTWNMALRQRGLPVLLVIRQEGNIYPSFWAGSIERGTLSLVADEDTLSGELRTRSRGGFAARVPRIPPKPGMEEKIPGGAWTAAGKAMNVAVDFGEFTDWQILVDDARKDPGLSLRTRARFLGRFVANEHSCPLEGTAVFTHSTRLATFTMTATATVEGGRLGLKGAQSGPLQFTFRVRGPLSTDRPRMEDRLRVTADD